MIVTYTGNQHEDGFPNKVVVMWSTSSGADAEEVGVQVIADVVLPGSHACLKRRSDFLFQGELELETAHQ